MEKQEIDSLYRKNLEEDIISYLAEVCSLDFRGAVDIYYSSRLSSQIEEGAYGIDNLDYKYLVNDLIENEPELFTNPN